MNNKTSIYVYKNSTDFLKEIGYLTDEYNKIKYYYKFIKDIHDVRAQTHYLKKTKILTASAFMTGKFFKITIRNKGQNYCITYKFKHRYDYNIFKRELRKIELS